MSGHTPGPWKAKKDMYGRWCIDAEDDSAWVARTVPPCDLKTRMAIFDTESDARLIAAAPDLLDALLLARKELHACQAVIHLAGGFDPAYVEDVKEALKFVESTIAKATGGAA